ARVDSNAAARLAAPGGKQDLTTFPVISSRAASRAAGSCVDPCISRRTISRWRRNDRARSRPRGEEKSASVRSWAAGSKWDITSSSTSWWITSELPWSEQPAGCEERYGTPGLNRTAVVRSTTSERPSRWRTKAPSWTKLTRYASWIFSSDSPDRPQWQLQVVTPKDELLNRQLMSRP